MDISQLIDVAIVAMKRRIFVLNILKQHPEIGIEGWFKCELLAELEREGIDVKIKNRGPDLVFGDVKFEVKGSANKSPKWIRKQGLKYGVPVLYLGLIESVDVLDPVWMRTVNDDWVVGVIEPEMAKGKVP